MKKNDTEIKEFGRRVRAIRKAIGLTQVVFAGHLDLAGNTICEIELGNSGGNFDFFSRSKSSPPWKIKRLIKDKK